MYKNQFCQDDLLTGNQEDPLLNHIITSLQNLLSGNLHKIDENSEKLFYDYLKISSVDFSAFSYNWPYIIQATRNNGFYYAHKESLIFFYFRGNLNDNKQYSLIIITHLGFNSEQSVYELTEGAKSLNIHSIMKNVDRDKISLWNTFGYTETIDPWSNYSFRDDNTFPELVYDLKKFINREFSNSTKRIISKIAKDKKYTFTQYTESLEKSALELLENNSIYLENKGVDFKTEVERAHEFIFNKNISNKTVFSVFEEKKLIAVCYLTQVDENLFFNAIINENKSNLMRFLLWKSVTHYCENLDSEKKPRFLALQGSENEGQYRWKLFFHPFRLIYRTHMTNHNF